MCHNDDDDDDDDDDHHHDHHHHCDVDNVDDDKPTYFEGRKVAAACITVHGISHNKPLYHPNEWLMFDRPCF